jgi:N-acetylmuramoyl-L-alanine amidase
MTLICIDPGHGGADPGCVGNGLREKDLTLDISNRVAQRLREHGFSVMMTRTSDVYVGLSERAHMANRAGADYFLSIHINAGGGTGFESFVQPGYDSGETGRIRGIIHKHVAAYFTSNGLRDRGQGQMDLAICRETNMPAALIECGFIDSSDAQKLRDPNFLQGIAEAVCKGLCEAFGVEYRERVASTPAQQQTRPQQWEIEAVQWLKANHLISNDHDPKAPVTWAELGAVIKNMKGGN